MSLPMKRRRRQARKPLMFQVTIRILPCPLATNASSPWIAAIVLAALWVLIGAGPLQMLVFPRW